MELNSNQIAELLPHRYPFALVDRITAGEPGQWARGIKCVSVNEQFFCGHFPQEHVMPGALILEAMAQVGCVAFLAQPENQGRIVLFGGVKDARFRRKVMPFVLLLNFSGYSWAKAFSSDFSRISVCRLATPLTEKP